MVSFCVVSFARRSENHFLDVFGWYISGLVNVQGFVRHANHLVVLAIHRFEDVQAGPNGMVHFPGLEWLSHEMEDSDGAEA